MPTGPRPRRTPLRRLTRSRRSRPVARRRGHSSGHNLAPVANRSPACQVPSRRPVADRPRGRSWASPRRTRLQALARSAHGRPCGSPPGGRRDGTPPIPEICRAASASRVEPRCDLAPLYDAYVTGPTTRVLLLLGSFVAMLVFFVLAVHTASTRDTTALENTLLQFFGIAAGAVFSWLIGDGTGRRGAEKELRSRAAPAFRRVVRLYEGHTRLIVQTDELLKNLKRGATDGKVEVGLVEAAMRTIRVQVSEQIGTSNDAMEDWRDLAPEEVAELEERARRRDEEQGGNGS